MTKYGISAIVKMEREVQNDSTFALEALPPVSCAQDRGNHMSPWLVGGAMLSIAILSYLVGYASRQVSHSACAARRDALVSAYEAEIESLEDTRQESLERGRDFRQRALAKIKELEREITLSNLGANRAGFEFEDVPEKITPARRRLKSIRKETL